MFKIELYEYEHSTKRYTIMTIAAGNKGLLFKRWGLKRKAGQSTLEYVEEDVANMSLTFQAALERTKREKKGYVEVDFKSYTLERKPETVEPHIVSKLGIEPKHATLIQNAMKVRNFYGEEEESQSSSDEPAQVTKVEDYSGVWGSW